MARRPGPVIEPVSGQGPWSDTQLVFGGGALEVDLRRPVPAAARRTLAALGLDGTFAVITPCNPRGRRLTDRSNRRRGRAFVAEVEAAGIAAIPAVGQSPDRSHREPGLALALTLAEAVALATRWGQLGLYWWDGRRFAVVRTGIT